MVLLQCALTRILLAAWIRSRFDISLVTPATISPVSALLIRCTMSPVVWSSSSHSRKSPTVQPLISSKIASLTASSMTRVTSSSSYGTAGFSRITDSGTSAST